MKNKNLPGNEPRIAANFKGALQGDLSLEGAAYPTFRRTTIEPQPRGGTSAERLVDVFLTAILAIISAPLMILVATILAYSSGPIIFSQTRIGRDGRLFQIYKFRTMVPDADAALKKLLKENPELREEWLRNFKLKKDPRVTLIGRFLRRTSLDELPQLWNILIGDMSLVGPRPVEPAEIAKYGRHARYYYAQRPGLTGLWQVSGRSNAGYGRRIVLDAFYSKNRSFLLDLKIICKTALIVVKGHGAY